MSEQEANDKLVWLLSNSLWPQEVICVHCDSMYTYKYILNQHGYGCTDCGKDFGQVIKLR